MGLRTSQWKVNLKYSEIYFGIDKQYHLPIWIDKTRQEYDMIDGGFNIYLPLGSTEAPFFHDGLAVADISGLANIIAEANKRAFLTSAYSKFGTRVLEKNLTDYSRVDIEDMQQKILNFTHFYFKDSYIENLKTWKLGYIIENSFKYNSGHGRILDTLLLDQSKIHVLSIMLNEFLREPQHRREAKAVLRHLEDFSAKQLFYISLVNRVCQKYGQKEYNHIIKYGPLPQILRTNVALSNLDDFAQTFKCPEVSPMNPRDKIYYWDRYVNVSLSEQNRPTILRSGHTLEGIQISYDDDD